MSLIYKEFSLRSCGREAEGGGLLNRYRVVKPYRGFESLRLRHHISQCPDIADAFHEPNLRPHFRPHFLLALGLMRLNRKNETARACPHAPHTLTFGFSKSRKASAGI